MDRLKKDVLINNPDNIKIEIDSGFGCLGEAIIELYDKTSKETTPIGKNDTENGAETFNIEIPEDKDYKNFAVTAFGEVSPLPGKNETYVSIALIDGDEKYKLESSQANFTFIFILK